MSAYRTLPPATRPGLRPTPCRRVARRATVGRSPVSAPDPPVWEAAAPVQQQDRHRHDSAGAVAPSVMVGWCESSYAGCYPFVMSRTYIRIERLRSMRILKQNGMPRSSRSLKREDKAMAHNELEGNVIGEVWRAQETGKEMVYFIVEGQRRWFRIEYTGDQMLERAAFMAQKLKA